ncbi:MAG: hypothetical protein ABEI52_11715 [Halobacteriaceae archaeon]
MSRERDENGQYKEEITEDAVLDVFDHFKMPVVISSDIARALDCTTQAARQKLQQLYLKEKINRRKTGRVTLYWKNEDARIIAQESDSPRGRSNGYQHDLFKDEINRSDLKEPDTWERS